jgi:hypothetical protein
VVGRIYTISFYLLMLFAFHDCSLLAGSNISGFFSCARGGCAVRDILAGVLTCLHLVEVCVRSRGSDFCRALFATGPSAADYLCSANFELYIRLGLEQNE